jgi:hypothetical protein
MESFFKITGYYYFGISIEGIVLHSPVVSLLKTLFEVAKDTTYY